MKLQGKPNQLVQKRVFKQGQFKIVPWFRFNDKGVAELDENKISNADLNKLARVFKMDISKEKDSKEELSEDEIRKLAKEKGIKSWHVKAVDTLRKELGV